MSTSTTTEKMEEKLIFLVSEHSCLYQMTSPDYHNVNLKNNAWRNISFAMGLPGKREKNEEKERKRSCSGAARGSRRWKYMSILNFLEPYIQDRVTSSNFCQNRHILIILLIFIIMIFSPLRQQMRMHTINNKPDDEERFLLSIAGALRCLPPRSRSEVKLKFQQILHEAQFSSDNQ
uniref:MADF domain-containing protein n=1 Tax=Sinocyclocheilus grahami TaxID=75366 RepID=A0A672LQL9_SINGR